MTARHRYYLMAFTENALPDKKTIKERENLQFSLSLIEKGSFTDKKPDYFGVWDLVDPSHGYFEVFLDNSDSFSGKIIDSNGLADFNGTISEEKLFFLKEYECPAGSAIKTEIEYKGRKIDEGFYGRYHSGSGGNIFYMTDVKRKPIELALKLEKHWLENEEFYRLGKM